MKPNDNLNIFDSSFLTSEKHHELSKEELKAVKKFVDLIKVKM